MDIYNREEFMEIYKNPTNKGKIEHPSVLEHGVNEMCGDDMDLYLKIQNDKIIDAKFMANSCSVGVVSSSILLESIIGKSLEDIKKISKEDLLEMIGINLTTSRIKCATLPLEILKKGIENYESRK
jgi:nitrogen fixation protein NifU and related proteins